jgi:long-chain acyl-CoA synthetase
MDTSDYTEIEIAPKTVFDFLPERKTRVRFMLPAEDGEWEAMTWGEFANQIRRCGLWLEDIGLERGERATIYAPNSVEWASAALAIQGVGGVMVPIYPSSTAEQASYIVGHSGARVVFVDTAPLLENIFAAWDAYQNVEKIVLLDSDIDASEVFDSFRTERELNGEDNAPEEFSEVAERITTWTEVQDVGRGLEEAKPGHFEELLEQIDLGHDALMLYTSGTTGRPKGVPLTHRNVGSNGRDWVQCNGPVIPENAVDLCWLPMSHVFGFGEICLGNTLGFRTYMSDPVTVLDKLQEVRPHVFMSIPRYWEKIALRAMDGNRTPDEQRLALNEVTGGNLEFCLSGGAGLKREIKEFFHDNGLLIIEGYGLTEASPTLTLNRPDDFRFDSVGKPLPSVEIKLAEDGEILARGPNVFNGYHKNPEATEETFTDDGWLKTGDLGKWTEDGFLQIIGRKKEILVTAGGKNVSPAHIEGQFEDDPYIEHAVVYGDGEKYLTAGIWLDNQAVSGWLDDNGVADEEREAAIGKLVDERVDLANAELPRYETIKKHRIIDTPLTVENGFLTPTLKVKRKKVYEAFGDQLDQLYEEG